MWSVMDLYEHVPVCVLQIWKNNCTIAAKVISTCWAAETLAMCNSIALPQFRLITEEHVGSKPAAVLALIYLKLFPTAPEYNCT